MVMRYAQNSCLIPYSQHPSPDRSPPTRGSTPYSQAPSSSSGYGAQYRTPHPSYQTPHPVPQPATSQTAPTYHLFDLSDQGLVHRRSSTRDDLDPTIPKPRLPPSDPARKYVCDQCGNRFSKQSTLRVSWHPFQFIAHAEFGISFLLRIII